MAAIKGSGRHTSMYISVHIFTSRQQYRRCEDEVRDFSAITFSLSIFICNSWQYCGHNRCCFFLVWCTHCHFQSVSNKVLFSRNLHTATLERLSEHAVSVRTRLLLRNCIFRTACGQRLSNYSTCTQPVFSPHSTALTTLTIGRTYCKS